MANEEKQEEEKGGMSLDQKILKHATDTSLEILKFSAEKLKTKKHDKIEKAKLMSVYGRRLEQDLSLRKLYDITRGSGYAQQMGKAFLAPYTKYVKKLYKEYYSAIKKENNEDRDKAFASLRLLKQEIDAIKQEKADYGENMFGGAGGGTQLSKGNSTQQISIADQLYTQNPDLKIFFGEARHIKEGVLDFYENAMKVNEQYGIVEDLEGREVFVNMKEGNSGLFVPPMAKALEFQELRKEQVDIAREAVANKQSPKLDVGRIGYAIDKMFLEKETVLSFTHDDILEDGSTFKEHLYNHKDLTKIQYVDFELEDWDQNRDGYIDELDRERIVDAITNPDSQFFNVELLRDLVKDYFTKKIYMAWGKNMGFEDGWLQNTETNMLKINMERFKLALESAKEKGLKTFMFDGEQYRTIPNVDQVQDQIEYRTEVDYMKKYNIQ